MKKIGLLKNDEMGQYEKEQGWASYRTIVERFIGDIVLCNNAVEVDSYILENMDGFKYINSAGEYVTEEEYYNDMTGEIEIDYPEIYQYYLCHVGQYDKEFCQKCGLIFSYSEVLDCDVLCVDHWGTSWDYVLTDCKLFDNWEDLENYEKGNDENE